MVNESKGRRGGRGGGPKKAPARDKPDPQKQAALEAERLEKERKEKELAAKEAERKEKEALNQKIREAVDLLKDTITATQRHVAARENLKDVTKFRKEFEANKKKLKTDIKKCTAFVKKVKGGQAWSMKPEDIERDVSTLNLSRYVEEVAKAVLETKPKPADIPAITSLSIVMHQRYEEYLPNLVPGLWNVLNSPQEDPKLRRVYLRILTEFWLSGLISEAKPFVKCIAQASGAKDGEYVVQDANMLVSFAKAATHEILGTTSQSIQNAMNEITNASDPRIDPTLVDEGRGLVAKMNDVLAVRAVDGEPRDRILAYFEGAFKYLSESLVTNHSKLQKLEKRCAQDRLLSGALPEAREKGLDDARKLKEALLKSVESLADSLDKDVPNLSVAVEDEEDKTGGLEVWTKGNEEEDTWPFDDEDTRAFYCNLPDLLTTTPSALLGLSSEAIEAKRIENEKKYSYGDEKEDFVGDEEALPDVKEEESGEEARHEEGLEEEEAGNDEGPQFKLKILLEDELLECNRREQVDDIAEKFCSAHGSSKKARKRLSLALQQVPHSRIDLIPFYSRLASIVDRIWSDVTPDLLTGLEQRFHGQAKYRKNQFIESRMQTAKYIGELTKFRTAPPILFIRCLRRCLDDFTGNNVDIACTLLESCGRFLYRLPHTGPIVEKLMETMTRLSKAKNLDERSTSLIKAAFYSVNPPASSSRRQVKTYSPLETYLRHLLLVELDPSPSKVTFTAKQLTRLPWLDPTIDCAQLVVRLMLKTCRRGRYKSVQAVAALASSLKRFPSTSDLPIRLVDAILEELKWSIERPNFRDQQRIITYARLLGELHARSQVTTQVIMNQLYDMINLGHEIPKSLREVSKSLGTNGAVYGSQKSAPGVSGIIKEDEEFEGELETVTDEVAVQPVAVSDFSTYDPRVPSDADPPNATFRVQLACNLLEYSARSIVTKANARILDSFLTAFQRYLFTKVSLPTDVEFCLLDTFDELESRWKKLNKNSEDSTGQHIGFTRYSTWIEAHNATVAIEENESLQRENGIALYSNDDEEDDDNLSGDAPGEDAGEEIDEDLDFAGDDGSNGSEWADEDDEEDEDSNYQSDESFEEGYDSESFDEEAYMRKLEEEAFERELRQLTIDALEKGKNASRKQVASTMPSGSQFLRKKENEATNTNGRGLDGKIGISFQLLQKSSKGKVEARSLMVPADSNIARAAERQDEEAAKERDMIKQRVLQYEAESAESGYGNLYLEEDNLQYVRNRPLTMEEIDRNFGTSSNERPREANAPGRRPHGGRSSGRGRGRGGRGRGRTGRGGRSLV